MVAPLLRALAALHARHVMHRDIKPENIFLTHTMAFKLGDLVRPAAPSGEPRAARPWLLVRTGRLGWHRVHVASRTLRAPEVPGLLAVCRVPCSLPRACSSLKYQHAYCQGMQSLGGRQRCIWLCMQGASKDTCTPCGTYIPQYRPGRRRRVWPSSATRSCPSRAPARSITWRQRHVALTLVGRQGCT